MLDVMSKDIIKLQKPVPSYRDVRLYKEGYRDYPIDKARALFHEPLVFIKDYGLAGQAYWSRPNSATGTPIKGVNPEIRVRKNVADLHKRANEILKSLELTKIFGYEVELFVQDGLRTMEHQRYMYEVAFPEHIAKTNPTWSQRHVLERRDDLVAKSHQIKNRPFHRTCRVER